MTEAKKTPTPWPYRIFGESGARPLLCLHGFMGEGEDFAEMGRLLSGQFRLVAPDLPGHGRTMVMDQPQTTMELCAAMLVQWLDDIGLHRPHLWGYSMGGRLGLYLALHYPERFDKVVLESASPGLSTEAERMARREHDEALARRLETGPLADFVDFWFAQPLFASLYRYPEKLQALRSRRIQNDPHGLAASLRAMGAGVMPPLWDKLPSLSRPTLLIAGGRDSKFLGIGRRMRQLSDWLDFRQIDDAGHNVHFEKPHAVADVIADFVSR